jgi:hypothetical protein
MTAEQLQQVMQRCRESVFFSLAEVVIGNGMITLEALETLLIDYCQKLRLGELALANGLITEEQLAIALAMQESSGNARIGEIFIELHFATSQQIDMLLDIQMRCRSAAVVA